MSTPRIPDVIELMKPITWFAPMWAYACGVVSSGMSVIADPLPLVAGVILAGPLLCASSQVINDWQDRHVDAINQPERPIPSGRLSPRLACLLAIALSLASLLLAAALGPWVFGTACVGLFLSWAYSTPPLRLKRDGWYGNAAVALSYEGLAWFAGAAVMSAGFPGSAVLWMALCYSIGAHGIMTLNDFKAVAGDREMGVASLPARYGIRRAARLACLVMAGAQLVVIGLLLAWQLPGYAAAITSLLIAQGGLMRRFMADPVARAPWYNATGTTLYVIGMMITAVAIRGLS
ncbi:chlorophyll synthase ChlG [Salinisphaera sp. Q1T1-3]|uniref:chlorophyll synthase ChlG n=1 Tax=Salinisphaera sp. Q1T1-3 TaxID=2321229 RepID=UPI000E71FD8C|nr:chlorophyll synthase ChlG [Salinisphaera sp. Q1T1-3]RJS92077.1 chlorophyll synthase ChlG [Salinisphaera sp. Q1T1-3]